MLPIIMMMSWKNFPLCGCRGVETEGESERPYMGTPSVFSPHWLLAFCSCLSTKWPSSIAFRGPTDYFCFGETVLISGWTIEANVLFIKTQYLPIHYCVHKRQIPLICSDEYYAFWFYSRVSLTGANSLPANPHRHHLSSVWLFLKPRSEICTTTGWNSTV